MKKLFLSIIATMFFISTASAVELILPVKPGGGTHRTGMKIQAALADSQGIKAELKFTGSCKVAEKMWNDATGETIMLANASLWATGCNLGTNIKDNEYVVLVKAMEHAICRASDNPTLTLDKFLNPSISKIVGSSYTLVNSMKSILEDTGNKSSKVVNFGNSRKLKVAATTKDADYWYMTVADGHRMKNLTCIATVGSGAGGQHGPLLKDVAPNVKVPVAMNADMIIVKNSNRTDELRKMFGNAVKDKNYVAWLKASGLIDVSNYSREQFLSLIPGFRATWTK
tara:strand:+ start:1360 stop:2211 length:852 start_codon:yes stop_codon:yes gene_type:complete